MKIIFCDWHHWVYPPLHNDLKDLLLKCGVECKDMQPAPTTANNSKLDITTTHIVQEEYRGFNIRSFIKAAVLRETKWYGEFPEIEKKYMAETMEYIDWAFKIFKEEKPDYVVIEGGLTHFHRVIGEVARELRIGIIALENSFIKDKIFIEFNTGYVCNRFSFARESQDWLDTRAFTDKKRKEANKIIKNVLATNNLKYPTTGKFDFTQLKKYKTIFVPLQVAYDQVVLYDSTFNNQTFIEKTMEIYHTYFKDWNIIFKCHPTSERLLNGRRTGDWFTSHYQEDNVYLVRGAEESANIQDLIKHSDLTWVNNSQAGVMMCLLNKPVVVFGDAFYSKKGFTLEYSPYIDWNKIKENPDSIKNYEQCKLWFYFFYKYLYTKPLTLEEERRIRKRLNIKENR